MTPRAWAGLRARGTPRAVLRECLTLDRHDPQGRQQVGKVRAPRASDQGQGCGCVSGRPMSTAWRSALVSWARPTGRQEGVTRWTRSHLDRGAAIVHGAAWGQEQTAPPGGRKTMVIVAACPAKARGPIKPASGELPPGSWEGPGKVSEGS